MLPAWSRTLRCMDLKAAVTAVLSTAGLGAGAAIPAHAQEGNDRALIEEVMVTAERRTQNLQEVPIAATVLTAEDLQRKSVDDVTDLQQAAPAIVVNTVNRSTFVNIRGVGLAQTAPTSVPGVAFYIDGQLIPHEQYIRQAFFDLESIEVLRGPQGTLTGQNSTGGAVYITTPEPKFDSYDGSIDQTVGNYDWSRTVGAVNLGFSENVALRIAAAHEEMDSFTDNIGPSPTSPGDLDQDAVRANLAIRALDDKLNIHLRGEYFDYRSGNSAIKNRNDAVTTDPFVIEEDGISYLNQTGYRASAEVRYDFGPMAIRALSSYQDGKARDQVDGDRTATAAPQPPRSNVGRVSYSGTDFLTRINEINLLSSGDGPVQWVVGAFSLDEVTPVFVLRDNNHVVNFVSSTSTILTKADTESQSVFGQVNWFVSPRWELIGGARYSWDEQVYARIQFPGPPLAPADRVAKQESEELTGKVAVNFHASDDMLMYLSASKGYKAGGVNLSPGPNFKPETNFVYEAGVKQTLMDRHLRVNGAVFYSDYQDIQYSSLQAGLPLQQNADSIESYGAELELVGQFGGLGMNLGVAYLHAEFAEPECLNDSFNSVGTGSPCTPGNSQVPKGRNPPFAPDWTVNAGVQYEWVLGAQATLTPRIQWSRLSQQYSTPFPQQPTTVPARDVVDARVSLAPSERWQIDAFANNVLDETYIAAQVGDTSSASGGEVYGAPRQYGVRAIVRF